MVSFHVYMIEFCTLDKCNVLITDLKVWDYQDQIKLHPVVHSFSLHIQVQLAFTVFGPLLMELHLHNCGTFTGEKIIK